MKVVLYWENSLEEPMAIGLIGPLRRWIVPIAQAIWRGTGRDAKVKVEIQARPQLFNVENGEEYVLALERAVFAVKP